jgi:NAD(P)-dependent dehydrogenase (short-subunit alcohol dehydrogenase family)
MDIAIVTGASSALGQAISGRLMQLGFRVYGLGGDYKDCPLKNVNFKPVGCDLADAVAVDAAAKAILEKEKGVCLLVNNAKYFGSHSFGEMSLPEMERVLRINLLCPLVLARALSGSLASLQGYIINLGATSPEASRGGPLGAAAAGGLRWMGETLFQDLRDFGVKVCQISPEPNRGRDARLTARRGAKPEASLDPEAVAQAVEEVVQNRYGNIITEMVLRPLRINEPDLEPVIRLPYPEPQPIPYTVPREVIEAEERAEEAAYEAAREKKRERRKERVEEKKTDRVESDKEPEAIAPRGVGSESVNASKEAVSTATPATEGEESSASAGEGRSRRRRRRKPKPPMVQVGFIKKELSPAGTDTGMAKDSPSGGEKGEAKGVSPTSQAAKGPVSEAASPVAKASRSEAKVAPTKRPRTRPARKTGPKATKAESAPTTAAAPVPGPTETTSKKAVEPSDSTAPAKPTKTVAAKKAAPRKTARKRAAKKAAKKVAEDGKSS